MANVVLATAPLVYVSWSCRRCGHTGGIARTTVPLESTWTEAMGRALFADLRRKLVRVHMKQGCVAVPDDFAVSRLASPPPGKTIIGAV